MTTETDEYDKDCIKSALETESCPNCGIDLKAVFDKIRDAEHIKTIASVKELLDKFEKGEL